MNQLSKIKKRKIQKSSVLQTELPTSDLNDNAVCFFFKFIKHLRNNTFYSVTDEGEIKNL